MIFNFFVQKLLGFGCCTARERSPSRTIQQRPQSSIIQQDIPILLNPALIHYQVQIGYSSRISDQSTDNAKITPPTQDSLQNITEVERNSLKEPILQARMSKRKTIQKTPLLESEKYLNQTKAQMNEIEDKLLNSSWELILLNSDKLLLYMNKPIIDVTNLRNKIELFGYFLLDCFPEVYSEILVSHEQSLLDDQIDNMLCFEENNSDKLTSNKFHITYKQTLHLPESEMVIQTIMHEVNGVFYYQNNKIYYEVTKSIHDERYPNQEDRRFINVKSQRVQPINTVCNLPDQYKEFSDSQLTLVTFYLDQVHDEVESYQEIEQYLIESIQSYVAKVTSQCQKQ